MLRYSLLFFLSYNRCFIYRILDSRLLLDNWPSKGEVVFENVSLRYDADRNPVIADLSLRIPAGQKVIGNIIR